MQLILFVVRMPWCVALAILATFAGCNSDSDVTPDPMQNVKVIDDRPGSTSCVDPVQLPESSGDVNNMPQAEVAIDVAPDGRVAAAAKDLRYGPLGDSGYNRRVWNGLYVSGDGGTNWSNRLFDDRSPNTGLETTTTGAYGRPAGQPVRLDHETDPAVAFDEDGSLYTCALAYGPGAPGDPSAIAVSRRDHNFDLVSGTLHLMGVENDGGLFNDKNWLTVDRDSPTSSTIVIASWRLFANNEALDGAYIAVSADGAATFGQPIHLAIPSIDSLPSQFVQPIIGIDPETSRKTVFVFYTKQLRGVLSMGLIKAPLDRVASGTAALHAHLSNAGNWTHMANRIAGLQQHEGDGVVDSFRFTSFFYPAIDRQSGTLFVVVPAIMAPQQGSRVLAYRSTDGGRSWVGPALIDDPDRGHQVMAASAADNGVLSILWYDSRDDQQFSAQGPIFGIDVYYGEMDLTLNRRRVERLTPTTQRADLRAFTVDDTAAAELEKAASGTAPRGPHEPRTRPEPDSAAESGRRGPRTKQGGEEAAEVACRPYGFIGDYIGLAADADNAYAAWCDLRDIRGQGDLCQGSGCSERRNQNIYFAKIPKN